MGNSSRQVVRTTDVRIKTYHSNAIVQSRNICVGFIRWTLIMIRAIEPHVKLSGPLFYSVFYKYIINLKAWILISFLIILVYRVLEYIYVYSILIYRYIQWLIIRFNRQDPDQSSYYNACDNKQPCSQDIPLLKTPLSTVSPSVPPALVHVLYGQISESDDLINPRNR